MVGRGGGPPPQQENQDMAAMMQAMAASTAATAANTASNQQTVERLTQLATQLITHLAQQGGGNQAVVGNQAQAIIANNARSMHLGKRYFLGPNVYATFSPKDKDSNPTLILHKTTHELLSSFFIFITDAHNGIPPEISTIILELKYVLSLEMRERWATHELGHPITDEFKQHFLATNNAVSFQTWFDKLYKTLEMQKNAHTAFHAQTMKDSGTPETFYKDLLQLRTACLNNDKLYSVNLTAVYKAFYNGLGTIFQGTVSDYHAVFNASPQTEAELLTFATACEPKWEAHLAQHPMDAPERVFAVHDNSMPELMSPPSGSYGLDISQFTFLASSGANVGLTHFAEDEPEGTYVSDTCIFLRQRNSVSDRPRRRSRSPRPDDQGSSNSNTVIKRC